jgi:hypothetical protein
VLRGGTGVADQLVKVCKQDETETGVSATTGQNGTVVVTVPLPDVSYKAKTEYKNATYWSQLFKAGDAGVQIILPIEPGPGVDTDGDGMPDAWEVANGMDPNDATGVNGAEGDLDGDGDRNIFEYEIGTQANDAGSGLAGESAAVLVEYRCQQNFDGIILNKTLTVLGPAGEGGTVNLPGTGAYMALPEPFRAGPGTIPVAVEFYSGMNALHGTAQGAIPYPVPDGALHAWFLLSCGLLGQPAYGAGHAFIFDDHTFAGGTQVDMQNPGAYELRQKMNGLQAGTGRTQRRILYLEGLPEPAGVLDAVQAQTAAGPVTLTLDKSESRGTLWYQASLRPLRTDLDMQIGCVTWGENKSQEAPEHLLDPVPGVVVSVNIKLPGAPEGFPAPGTARTVALSWPIGCFNATDGEGEPVLVSYDFDAGLAISSQKGARGAFTWLLTRTNKEMPVGGTINASVVSIPAGDASVAAVMIGTIAVRPAALGSAERTYIDKFGFVRYVSGRAEYPIEDLLTMKSGESVDKGVLFTYGVQTAPLTADPNVTWEVWNTARVDELQASGFGKQFTTRLDKEGSTVVRYYADRNSNGHWDWPAEESGVSPSFKVKPVKVWQVDVARHKDVVFADALVRLALVNASLVVRHRDGEDDWRACAMFTLKDDAVRTWATPPDQFALGYNEINDILKTVGADFHIVQTIYLPDREPHFAGGYGVKGLGALVTPSVDPILWAHEWGHVLGLWHYNVDGNVMHDGMLETPGHQGSYLTRGQADAFEGG